jgi:hypothetical protein
MKRLGGLFLLVATVFVLAACSSSGGEVFLEPAREAGADPFTADVSRQVPTPPALAPASTESAIESRPGTAAELYGGSGELGVCDKAALSRFLAEDDEKREAWAAVLGITPADDVEVSRYIEGLAAVVLRADTRVTNHGYTDGAATPRQAVLQAGTAVLVDRFGVPRVRCACGNPLLEPIAAADSVNYVGDAWDGFSPTGLLVVTPAEPVKSLTVIKLVGQGTTNIPVSSGLEPEASQERTPTAPGTTTSATTTSAPSAGDDRPAGTYLECSPRYAQAVIALTQAGIAPDPQWPADAERAAELANAGDLAGALQICEDTVAAMNAALADATP